MLLSRHPTSPLRGYLSPFLLAFAWLAFIIIPGCSSISQEEKDALKQIARTYHADINTRHGYIKTNDTNKESGKYLEITIKNPASFTPENHGDLFFPAAGCAYKAYKAQLKSSNNSYDFIRVIFQIGVEKSTFEYSYSRLKLYDIEYQKVTNTLHQVFAKEYNYDLFFHELIPSTDARKIYRLLQGTDANSLELLGFKEGLIGNQKAVSIKFLIRKNSKPMRIKINTFLGRTSNPIAGFSIEDLNKK